MSLIRSIVAVIVVVLVASQTGDACKLKGLIGACCPQPCCPAPQTCYYPQPQRCCYQQPPQYCCPQPSVSYQAPLSYGYGSFYGSCSPQPSPCCC